MINIPVMLDIITNADNEIYEDNLLIITDAYQVRNYKSIPNH